MTLGFTKKALALAVAVTTATLSQMAYAQLEEVIVTAQKRAESIQDVPIAITAFDEEAMQARQITGFADMRFAAPNVSYSKNNFSGSNFQIRGVGTNLVAASSDNGVGVHVNEVPLITPRLFETEYFDVEQVAVLRGPQGTLYGRNSTGGAVNMITRTALPDQLEGNLEAQLGNYEHKKINGAINIPLSNQFAARFAGLWLERDGYTDNKYTGNDVDGREQYALRATFSWLGENTSADLMFSYFDEDSSRSRSQKIMCHNDPTGLRGCLPDKLDFDLPNPDSQLSNILASTELLGPLGVFQSGVNRRGLNPADYREVYADRDPIYKSDESLITLQIKHETDKHTIALVAGYQDTSVFSQMDYLWNVGGEVTLPALFPIVAPVAFETLYSDGLFPLSAPSKNVTGTVGGHIDERLSRLEAYDQSNRTSEQYSIELSLQSDYDGAFNFLLGAFWLDVDLEEEFWVISNGFDYLTALVPEALSGQPGKGWVAPVFKNATDAYSIESSALFGELYYDFTDAMKLTVGGRYTIDEKNIRDRAFLLNSDVNGERIFQDFGADLPIPEPQRIGSEKWSEFTGRVVLDWSVSADTLAYISYSRGYKGGGFNPPFNQLEFPDQKAEFDPEFVDAFEIGIKNTLLDNTLQANFTAFFYDYQDMQISKIVNRTSFNENTDAEIYGLEAEMMYAPDQHWLLNANLAYLHTKVGDFQSVDTRDPTDGRDDVTLIKDINTAANCVVLIDPEEFAQNVGSQFNLCGELTDADLPVTTGIAVNLNGNRLQNVPEVSLSLGAQYSFELQDYTLSLRLDYYWQDEMYARLFNRPIDKIDAWDIWNAQANLRNPDDAWYLRAYIKNIADEDHLVGMFVTDPSSGLFTNVFTIEPRSYGLAVGYNFN